jgi:hypothetical protein
MKIINTKLHGMLDYFSAFLMVSPWISNFNTHSSDTWILASAGAISALYSVFTDYEFGLIKLIPMKTHFVFDGVVALFLIACPFIFSFPNYLHYWPILLGVLEIVIILLSSPASYRVTRRDLDITRP